MISRLRRRAQTRRLRAADSEAWRELRLEALRLHPEAYASTHDDWAGRSLADFVARLEDGWVFGGFRDGVLVGSVALDPADAETGEITAVYVKPELRGQGIARALMKAVIRKARREKLTCLTLSLADCNTPAERFYKAAGFAPEARQGRALIRDGRMIELISMVRHL